MKEKTIKIEEMFLSPYAKKSIDTLGRDREEAPCPMRTEFQRDRDRIIHSKAFRRLKNKTQVFFSPEGDHFRTRLTHTLDVSQIARSIARTLSLNEDLTEAIALGHDLGHTPFGHSGERILDSLCPTGFKHNVQSRRVVEVLANNGKGLNLTKEVRDGIENHKMSLNPSTLEGRAVSISDWIAYINHDIDDAISSGVIKEKSLPKNAIKVLGKTSRERINTMIYSIYKRSDGQNKVEMEEDVMNATKELRSFMFEYVYRLEETVGEEEKANRMIAGLYDYYKNNVDKLPDFYKGLIEEYGIDIVLCDFISSMSDKYAVYLFENLFIPKSWKL
ncbi:MAG: deoxyguanosinetriphosphate triphosphohydrolase [Clostridiales bacterium]|nr:deoxyguanosinetriphosphate triphosphohydrolase [Clostridiales bacterium]